MDVHLPLLSPSVKRAFLDWYNTLEAMSRFISPSAKDLIERLSRQSISQHEHELEQVDDGGHERQERIQGAVTPRSVFAVLGTPPESSARANEHLGHLDINDTTEQVDKPTVNVLDRRWSGLVLHSAAVGIVSTILPLCVYPFLTCNLNMEGTQTLSARTLLGLPWALKPVMQMLIHCSPLPNAFRLRSAVVVGWAITSAALIAISCRDQPKPYFQDRETVGTPLTELSAQQMSTINFDAPRHGAFYVMLMCMATLGYVLADVAADELIRDVATHHFGVEANSRDEDAVFQPVMTKFRTIAILGCFPFMGVAMSGWDYGGDFDFTLEYTQVMLAVGLVSLLPVLLSAFTIAERPRERRSLRQSLRGVWTVLHNCALNSVLTCRFVGGVFAGVSATAVNPVAFYYAGVQPLNDTVVSFVAIVVVLLAIRWATKKGWDVDYRAVIIVGTVAMLALDCGATLFTIWGVIRSQWFWIGLPVMEAIPSALDYTISTVVLAEVVDPAAHATMSSLVTAVAFLAGPLGLALSKYVDAQFDVSNQDIMADTTHVREHIMVTFFIAYAMQLASLLWLFALPRHSQEAREWKMRSGSSMWRGVSLLVLLGSSLVFVVSVHVLSVYEPTSCLGFSGGAGC